MYQYISFFEFKSNAPRFAHVLSVLKTLSAGDLYVSNFWSSDINTYKIFESGFLYVQNSWLLVTWTYKFIGQWRFIRAKHLITSHVNV